MPPGWKHIRSIRRIPVSYTPHTAEKSAEILVKTLSMQPTKRQTITPDEFRHLAKDFGVTLPEEFLYEK